MKLLNEMYNNEIVIRKFQTPDGTIFYTHSKALEEDEFIKTKQKPSEESIKELRYIKQVRRLQKAQELIKPSHKLAEQVKKIIGKHETSKEYQILAYDFLKLLKERNQIIFSELDINDLISEIVNKDAKTRVRKKLVKIMSNGVKLSEFDELLKIEKKEYKPSYYTWERRNLLTFDDSYELIKKRGYCLCGSNKSIIKHKKKATERDEFVVYEIIGIANKYKEFNGH